MKKVWVIHKKEVPETMAVEDFIYRNTDILEKINQLPKYAIDYLKLPVTYSAALKNDVLKIANEITPRGYVYASMRTTHANYQSIPLTYNPDSKSPSLSSALPASNEYEDQKIDLANRKNSPVDTLNINKRAPFLKGTIVEKFLNEVKREIVRSKIVIHRSDIPTDDPKSQLVWHKDESIFFNLRILIPIQTTDNFGIEFISKDKNGNDLINNFTFENDHVYTLDTHSPHRYICRRKCEDVRIGLVLGINPWFDYDPQNETWASNDFYGEMHPYDMLLKGHILPFNFG